MLQCFRFVFLVLSIILLHLQLIKVTCVKNLKPSLMSRNRNYILYKQKHLPVKEKTKRKTLYFKNCKYHTQYHSYNGT